MMIIIEGTAIIQRPDGEPSTLSPDELRAFEGREVGEEECSWYIADQLGDTGIIGGRSYLAVSDKNEPRVRTVYWAPGPLTPEQERRLIEDTIGQWEDGVGSNGFPLRTPSSTLLVRPHPDNTATLWQQEDHRLVPLPSQAAIAAREGRFADLTAALDSGEALDRPLRGYTPLHLGILYGHQREVSCLLNRGADPNVLDKDGNSPLVLCASTRAMDDEGSAQIARRLLAAGARRDATTKSGQTARDIAQLRGKLLTARMLE